MTASQVLLVNESELTTRSHPDGYNKRDHDGDNEKETIHDGGDDEPLGVVGCRGSSLLIHGDGILITPRIHVDLEVAVRMTRHG